MSTYVLVHGAWHGPWCWEKVVPLLKQAGHRVETPDLSGYGQDKTFREITLNSDSLVTPNLVVNEEQGSLTFKEGAPLKDMFYGDCSDEDVARATSLLVPGALAPQGTPVRISAEHFGRVPRVYIECLRDRALTPSFQKGMYTATPCQAILSMETSHSPFFSAPQELVHHLTSLLFVSL